MTEETLLGPSQSASSLQCPLFPAPKSGLPYHSSLHSISRAWSCIVGHGCLPNLDLCVWRSVWQPPGSQGGGGCSFTHCYSGRPQDLREGRGDTVGFGLDGCLAKCLRAQVKASGPGVMWLLLCLGRGQWQVSAVPWTFGRPAFGGRWAVGSPSLPPGHHPP